MKPDTRFVASCASGEPSERNSATDTGKSATSSATTAKPKGLKALAGAVLERNQQRNQNATNELRQSSLSATETEVRRLVANIYSKDTPEDQAEALQHALSDPVAAAECYRWILSRSTH